MDNIFTTSEYIVQLKEEVEENLVLANLPPEEVDKNLQALDLFILGRVSEGLSASLTEDQKSKLKDFVDKGTADYDELVDALGVTKEQLIELYTRELEDHLAELTRNVPNLKKEQNSTSST
jgi:hypothetical protein